LDARGGARGPGSSSAACSSSPTRSSEEIETMARLEHDRWLEEQGGRGRASAMVGWEELSEADREKDRGIARMIPEQLLAVGYDVVRDEPPLVPPR
jgi:hypothetical protein